MRAFILFIVILMLVTIFSVQNAAPVAIVFLIWKFEASLAIILFLSLLTGIVMGGLLVFVMRSSSMHRKKTPEPVNIRKENGRETDQ